MSVKNASFMVHRSLAGLFPKPEELKSMIDWRADSHWPNASSKISSGHKTPRTVRDNLRHSICIRDSVGPGIFMHRMDHEHRTMVTPQLQMISNVPLPSGPGVHPCLRSKFWVLFFPETVALGSSAITLRVEMIKGRYIVAIVDIIKRNVVRRIKSSGRRGSARKET